MVTICNFYASFLTNKTILIWVLYTKEKEYALVEYQKGKQTLSAERYLHYLNDFE